MDHYPKVAEQNNRSYMGSSGATVGSTTATGAPSPRQSTAIEALSRDLHQIANRFNLYNDNVEQKLEMFAPSDRAEKTQLNGLDPANPPDGTMAALHLQSRRLQHELERYGALWERLATII